jgi:hypothetical protein
MLMTMRSHAKTLAAATLLLAAAGCGNFQEAVKVRAASDLSCPVEAITLVQIRPYRQPQAYTARGCGRGEDYEGGCDLRGCLVDKRPSLAEQARFRREADSQRETAYSSPPSDPHGSAGAQNVSLTLHNDCPHTVRLFFGTTPKFGSGTESSISANTTEGHSMRAGEMIWILDGSGNGMSSLTASPGQTHVTITRSCTGFAPY